MGPFDSSAVNEAQRSGSLSPNFCQLPVDLIYLYRSFHAGAEMPCEGWPKACCRETLIHSEFLEPEDLPLHVMVRTGRGCSPLKCHRRGFPEPLCGVREELFCDDKLGPSQSPAPLRRHSPVLRSTSPFVPRSSRDLKFCAWYDGGGPPIQPFRGS